MVWAILYHFFSLYWVTQFMLASALTTAAGAVAAYYWAKGETAVSAQTYCEFCNGDKAVSDVSELAGVEWR